MDGTLVLRTSEGDIVNKAVEVVKDADGYAVYLDNGELLLRIHADRQGNSGL